MIRVCNQLARFAVPTCQRAAVHLQARRGLAQAAFQAGSAARVRSGHNQLANLSAQFFGASGARFSSTFKDDCEEQIPDRVVVIDEKLCRELMKDLEAPPAGLSADDRASLMEILEDCIPEGEAAYVKAMFLTGIVKGTTKSPFITPVKALELLATMETMLGGENVKTLVESLDVPDLAPAASEALQTLVGYTPTVFLFDAFQVIKAKADAGHAGAKEVVDVWLYADSLCSGGGNHFEQQTRPDRGPILLRRNFGKRVEGCGTHSPNAGFLHAVVRERELRSIGNFGQRPPRAPGVLFSGT